MLSGVLVGLFEFHLTGEDSTSNLKFLLLCICAVLFGTPSCAPAEPPDGFVILRGDFSRIKCLKGSVADSLSLRFYQVFKVYQVKSRK